MSDDTSEKQPPAPEENKLLPVPDAAPADPDHLKLLREGAELEGSADV